MGQFDFVRHFVVEIVIDGPIPKAIVPELCEIIASEHGCIHGFDGYRYCRASEADLQEAIEYNAATLGSRSLSVFDMEYIGTRFDRLEYFLQQNDIEYDCVPYIQHTTTGTARAFRQERDIVAPLFWDAASNPNIRLSRLEPFIVAFENAASLGSAEAIAGAVREIVESVRKEFEDLPPPEPDLLDKSPDRRCCAPYERECAMRKQREAHLYDYLVDDLRVMCNDMNLFVSNRSEAEHEILIPLPYVVISIYDPGSLKPRLKRPSVLQNVLFLQFHDAEPIEGVDIPDDIILMDRTHAEAIVDFVERYRDKIGAILVHCEQGMGRSPAVVAALGEWLCEDVKEILAFTHPNEHVYRLMCDAIEAREKERLCNF